MYERKTEKIITCPLEYGLDIFSGKWKSRILCVINHHERLRHKDFKALLPGITDPVLSAMLKDLIHDGMIKRQQFDEIPLRVEYFLSTKGKTLIPVLESICIWSNTYFPRDFNQELDHCRGCHILPQ